MNSVEFLSEKFINCARSLDTLLPGFSEPFEQRFENERKWNEEQQMRIAEDEAQEEKKRLEAEARLIQATSESDVEEFGQSEAERIAKWVIDEQGKRPQMDFDAKSKRR